MARGALFRVTAGWRVNIPEGATRFPAVDHFLLFIDGAYPYSDIRVAVPGMHGIEWPHVEGEEFLCLEPSSAAFGTRQRLDKALTDALDLLNWDGERTRAEFGREIRTYWNRQAGLQAPVLYSLVVPTLDTREVICCEYRDGFLIADSQQQVADWLKNDGRRAVAGRLRRTIIIGLPNALLPSEYPANGSALLKLAGNGILQPFLSLNRPLPILLAFQNESGRGFVGLVIQSPKRSVVAKGFRPGREPPDRAGKTFGSMPTRLCLVERVDRAWVYGRDHGDESAALRDCRVVIIGCGALGSPVAMALAQAGVGRFIFVDRDVMHSHNASRHVLGASWVGDPKASAMAKLLKMHFPTVAESLPLTQPFELLESKHLQLLAAGDLIICAGIDRRGEVFFDRWRTPLLRPPPAICTWSEEFALVGHAIAILGSQSLRERYGPDGNYDFLATTWPKGAPLIREAGCGNDFQPFGALDLMPTIQMAARLALDLLSGKVRRSVRRVWLGDRDRVVKLGGVPSDFFTNSNTINEYSWQAA
jgi:hypothetical protein